MKSIRSLMFGTVCFYTFTSGLLLFSVFFATAQTKDKTSGQQSLELPIVVVQGQDKFDVPAVIKKKPANTPPATRPMLDSLNSLEKRRPALLPPAGLPEPARQPRFADGFVEGEFGQFFTSKVQGGLGFTTGNYRLYADANIDGSAGHIDNAGYFTYGAGISSVYVAPEQFIFFGGSRTESAAKFGQRIYKLYGTQELPNKNVPERSTTLFSAGANIIGIYDDYAYDATGRWSGVSISQTNLDIADNGLFGSLKVTRDFGGYTLGARTALDFHTLRGTGYNLLEFAGIYRTNVTGTAVETEAGFQTAASTLGGSSGALHASGSVRTPLSGNFSLGASATTGLERASLGEFLTENPYLSSRTIIEHAKTSVACGIMLYYHPTPTLFTGIGGKFALLDNAPFFRPDTLGMFGVGYERISRTEASGELLWNPSNNDVVSANIAAVSAVFLDISSDVPYVPSLRASGEWTHSWNEQINTRISAVWYGKRRTTEYNNKELDGWLDIGFRADYTLSSDISFFARLTNIANSSKIIWDSYREQGVSGVVGLLWKF